MKKLLLALSIGLLPSIAMAQNVTSSGTLVPGHAAKWLTNGGVIGDAGGAAGSSKQGSGYITELGITNTGMPFCINDALTNAAGGYHRLCLGANALGGALLSYDALAGASPLPFQIELNGTLYPWPPTTGTGNVTGPVSTTVGHAALWANTAGTLLSDGGQPPSFAPGVVCDGTTDTTAAIQAIANAVTVGQLIILPPGICKVTTTVTFPKGVIIQGAGFPGMNSTADLVATGLRGTIIRTTAGSGDVFSFPIEDRAVVRDMMFDYTGGGTRSGGAYIAFVGNFTAPGFGTVIREPEASGVMFRNGYDDIRCDFCFAPRIYNTYNLDFAHAGVYIVQNATGADYGDGVFENNEFWELNIAPGTCQAGILALATGLMKVDGDKFNGCQRGVEIALTYGPTGTMLVRGNSFENNTDRAIYLHQASTGIDYGSVTVADNEFLNFGTQFPANGLVAIAAGTASVADSPNWIWRVDIHDNHFAAPYVSAAPLVNIQDGGGVTVHDNICDVALASGGPPCITVGGNAGGSASGFVALLNNVPVRYGGNAFYGAIKDGTVIRDILYSTGSSLGSSTAPTVASCGTSPTIAGTDQLFQVNVGSGGPTTSCAVTLAVKPVVTPLCFITGQASGAVVFSYAQSIVGGHQVITLGSSADMTGAAITVSCSP